MATYNEELSTYIAERYNALGNASRHMRALMEAKDHDKFTAAYTTEMRDLIEDYVELHHSADTNLPDLTTWTGANTPQRVYLASTSATVPTIATSTTGEMADNDYIPTGWVRNEPTPDATNTHVFRAERTGSLGAWSEWATPTLVAEYTA